MLKVFKIVKKSKNVIIADFKDYDVQKLIIESKLLVTDYSSVFFDYSITGKPMLHFCYDYEKYSSMRGLYFDIREKISGSDKEEDIIGIIKNMDKETEQMKTVNFRNQYVGFYGSATKCAVDYIAERIMR